MSILTNSLLELVQELRILTDSDEVRTAQNLTPIMGSHLTLEQVNLVARFLSSWNFEDVDFGNPKGVYLTGNGMRIPLSGFTSLGTLGARVGPDGLRKLGLLLQYAPAEFWQVHLPQRSKILDVAVDAIARFIDEAIALADRLYDDKQGGMTFAEIDSQAEGIYDPSVWGLASFFDASGERLSLQPSGSE